ncbi:MAG TPA: branched-chain alpha-keto acid dehydrogenase subunit E2, partial [Gammaproteobacteria bacterium]|nr:branched-chain alpha-keto acid dehydrogenase subunit E2 [Gammaproteobacteria bacterium]
DHLILKRYCHIGVAVDTHQGLLVPVIRDVDTQGVLQLAEALADIS